AVGTDAGIVHPLRIAHGEQLSGNLGDGRGLEPATVNPRAIIAPQAELDTGNRRHSSRRAEQMAWTPLALRRRAHFMSEVLHHRAQMLPHRSIARLRDLDAAEAFGHGDHARTERCPGNRLKRPTFALDPHE